MAVNPPNTMPQANASGSNASNQPGNTTGSNVQAQTNNGGVQGASGFQTGSLQTGSLTDNGGLNRGAYDQTMPKPVGSNMQLPVPNDGTHPDWDAEALGKALLYLSHGGTPSNPNAPRPGRIGSAGGRVLDVNGNDVTSQPTDIMGGRVFRSTNDRTPQATWDNLFRNTAANGFGAYGQNTAYQGMPGSTQSTAQFSPAYRQAWDTMQTKQAMESGTLPPLPTSPATPGGNFGYVSSASSGKVYDTQGKALKPVFDANSYTDNLVNPPQTPLLPGPIRMPVKAAPPTPERAATQTRLAQNKTVEPGEPLPVPDTHPYGSDWEFRPAPVSLWPAGANYVHRVGAGIGRDLSTAENWWSNTFGRMKTGAGEIKSILFPNSVSVPPSKLQ